MDFTSFCFTKKMNLKSINDFPLLFEELDPLRNQQFDLHVIQKTKATEQDLEKSITLVIQYQLIKVVFE